MEPDDWPFPSWFGPVMAVLFIAVVLGLSLVARTRSPDSPKVTGCYVTPNGPDILIDQRTLHVRQAKPLNVPYKLEYHKGWALVIDSWLNFRRLSDESIEVLSGPDFGEFLFLSREGVVADPQPGFDLINRPDGVFVHYSPTGESCHG